MTGSQPALVVGANGGAVLDVQARLGALGYPVPVAERGTFGPHTVSAVKAFQIRRGLPPAGCIDSSTWRELVEAGRRLGDRTLYRRLPYVRGDDVRDLQMRLNALGFDAGTEDGIFGNDTYRAVVEFQKNTGLPVDGIVGHDTVAALDRLRRQIRPGSKAELRQRLDREWGSGVAGRTIFVDPGHGGRDVGVVSPAGIPESAVVYRVAEAMARSLGDLGATPLVSRGIQQGPDVARRAGTANQAGADVAVSLHLSCMPDPGPSVAFWTCDGKHSALGRELARSVATNLRECVGQATPTLGRNLEFLRQTAMPAVVVDVSCQDRDVLITEEPYLASMGESIASGVRDYFCALASAAPPAAPPPPT